ncbi:hypothetical protein G3570_09635 [Balneolaceae bacterium YR4-1]|uniref:Phospholipid/glycerol acyltransferase domain-containing protein n=1 Tax=Halalkalibaculum roseum TaxID=2709311 RepID=A0A6M1T081_9BACT|nr:1-acyl-sn-glycerol-3-phosphate acyltransferase [Halalkalibaculum roseum]NGP76894.1 hypothetical protein [Halalkalibaculum roseum]
MNVTIRDWTFTHFWVRPVVKVWFDFYHKSVTYSGKEHLNWEKPIIFAASHQSAFTDALCLILPARYVNDRFIYPLVRADAFGNNKFIDWVLTSFHMMPVYRPKDKVDIKKRNQSVFKDCHYILSKNRNLLIHPEGNCFPIKKVRRFKKGLARIAFGAETVNDFDLDILIVPVGINYRKSTEARGGIHVRYGEPVSLADYEESYRQHEAAAFAELTSEVEQRVKEITVDIQLDGRYDLIEDTIRLTKNMTHNFTSHQKYSLDELKFEKEIVSKLEAVLKRGDETSEQLVQTIEQIREFLEEKKLDSSCSLAAIFSSLKLLVGGLGFVVMLPFFLYGWVNNIIPWNLIHKMADRIDDTQFINSARMAMGLLAFPVIYILQSLLVQAFSGSLFWTLGYFMSLPLSGIISLKLHEKWKEWRQQLKLKFMSVDNKNRFEELKRRLFSSLGIS